MRKNWKLKTQNEHYIDKDQLPIKVICIKVDYAEATGTHNTQNAVFVETLYDELFPAQRDNPKYRSTIYGKPILLFHQENEYAEPVFYGKANLNADKGAENLFGFTKDYDVECWEFKNNTSDACNFWSEIPYDWEEDFEARYPDGYDDISRFKLMHDWVVSTNQSKATNTALPSTYTDVDGNEHTHDTAAYRLAKFKTEFENWFNMHFSLIYYVYTFFALMVDQRAKNMFLTYWASIGKWMPYFYDNDTSFGINNEGSMAFDYYHTDEDRIGNANVYNGQNSTLWVNFREAFPDKIQETYQELRKEKLTYEKLINQFITLGSDKWSESIYNEDGDFKYMSMLRESGDATNLPQIRGTGEEHLRYFIENRLNFCDSKWYAGSYPDDIAVVRIYTPVDENNVPLTDLVVPANADITITPFSHMYAGVRYKANGTLYQERVEANQVITFEAPDEVFNDTETAVYGASQISSFGDLSPLYLGYVDVSKATKLIELIIGNSTPGYHNGNLYHLAVGTNRLLKKIDIQNCGGKYKQALNLTGCPNIEEIYAKGSDITGVDLPDSGYLKIMQLPNTVANITIKNQPYLNDFSLEGYNNVKTIHIENCPTIDTLDLLDKCENVERVRLTDVDWNHPDAELLYELIDRNIKGIDENNTNTDFMWVDGKCHIDYLTGEQYAYIKSKYPYLDITYGTLESQLIFMTYDGETELTRQTVLNAGNGVCPVTNGTIEAPVKEPTAQYTFAFNGWSKTPNGEADNSALLNVEADRVIYAAYSFTIRNYTVNFYVDGVIKETYTIPYGGTATYAGGTPTSQYDYLQFIGWSPSPVGITGDTNCYAQWYDNREITDDWETIAQACLDGTAVDKYAIGSYKNLDITYEDGTTETIPMEVAAHNHDELIDGVRKWEKMDALPFRTGQCPIVVWNNAIHLVESNGIHYKYDGSNWTQVSTMPYKIGIYGILLVYNNELHMLGSNDNKTIHSKWNGIEWVSVSTLPSEINVYTSSCVYNDEIHYFVGLNHYTWDGTKWTTQDNISGYNKIDFSMNALVYDDKIYLFRISKILIWDGSIWTNLDIPTNNEHYRTIIYDGNIHYFTATTHYKWDGTEWITVGALPYGGTKSCICTYNNEIHLVGSNDYANANIHYKWSGKSWESVFSKSININFCLEYNGDLYGIYNGSLVKFTNNTYISITNLPIDRITSMALYNGCVYIFSHNSTEHYLQLYKYDWAEWTNVGTVPMLTYNCGFIEYDGCLHLFGGYYSSAEACHWKYDGTKWISVGDCKRGQTLPFIYNDDLYAAVGATICKFDGIEWVEVDILPYTPNTYNCNTSIAVGDNEIFIHTRNGYNGTSRFIKGHFGNWTEFQCPSDVNAFTSLLYHKRNLYALQGSTSTKKYANPKATLTFIAKNVLKDDMVMNSNLWNAAAWYKSNIRTYLNDELIINLPNTLQNSIAEVIKISDYKYYTGVKYLVKSIDKLWIPTAEEVSEGGAGTDLQLIKGQGEVYPIFTDNVSRIRTKYGDTSGQKYWLRSTRSYMQTHAVNADGGVFGANSMNVLNGILIGFCI